jgi:hypothetical protein
LIIALFSTPFVLLSMLNGKDMQVQSDDIWEQKAIAAALLATLVLLIYFINNCYLGSTTSALLTVPWAFGSGMTTTIGAALWSIDFSTVLVLGVLLIVAGYFSGESTRLRPYLVGACLFAAYFCRPTAAVFIFAVILCYLWLSPWAAIRVAAMCAMLFGGFVCFSQVELAACFLSIISRPISYEGRLSPSTNGQLEFMVFCLARVVGRLFISLISY